MVARTQKKLRFKGGRGESFKGVRATPSGRAAPAPRISPPAAAAALRALKKLAAEVNMAWGPMLRQAATEDALWTRVTRAVEKEGDDRTARRGAGGAPPFPWSHDPHE